MRIDTYTKLKNAAFQVKPKTKIYEPLAKMTSLASDKIDFSSLKDKTFCGRGDVVVFVDEGNLYVIPFFQTISKILNYAGFRYAKMVVPFSSLEYPADEEDLQKWKKIKVEAKMYV